MSHEVFLGEPARDTLSRWRMEDRKEEATFALLIQQRLFEKQIEWLKSPEYATWRAALRSAGVNG